VARTPKGRSLADRLASGETSYDVVGPRRRRLWYAAATALMVISLGSIAVKQFELGIEFRGGSAFTVPADGGTVDQAREAVEPLLGEAPIVQQVGADRLRVQTEPLPAEEQTAIEEALAAEFGVGLDQIDTSSVGSAWGGQITSAALRGLAAFLVLVSLYIGFRYEFKMAAGALVALLHDLVLTAGVFSLFDFLVTPATVIGLLTILGYSLYDTVVVFDKVQENTRGLLAQNKMTYTQAANLAVNQTLVRSLNTSVIALLPVAGLLFIGAAVLGAGTLRDLSLALFVGIVAGTYSSITLATAVLVELKEREPRMRALAHRLSSRGGGVSSPAPRLAGVGAGRTSGAVGSEGADPADGAGDSGDLGDPGDDALSGQPGARPVRRTRAGRPSGSGGRPGSRRRR
jgi:preprotein translocase subunit SecF